MDAKLPFRRVHFVSHTVQVIVEEFLSPHLTSLARYFLQVSIPCMNFHFVCIFRVNIIIFIIIVTITTISSS